MSIASRFMKATRWNNLNYSRGNTHEKKAVKPGSRLPESVNLRKLKKQASEFQSFMFAISNQTYGGGGELSGCLEWSSCYTRDETVPRLPSSRHTHLPVKQMYNHMPCLHAPLHGAVALTSGWLHTASWKWGLSWSAFDKSCLRCQCVSCVSLSAKAFHIDTPLQST